MKPSIDKVYADVFGWKDAWQQINHALKDEIRFIRIAEDPRGMLARFARGGTMRSLSYAEQAYVSADVENEQHLEWRNPYEPAMVSNHSFTELADLAEEEGKAAAVILEPYKRFWPAEDYHQDYLDERQETPECHIYTKIF